MAGADVGLHLGLLGADVVADAAAEREHPLLLVHVERHVADELSVQLRLEATHVTAGEEKTGEEKKGEEKRREERRRQGRRREERGRGEEKRGEEEKRG